MLQIIISKNAKYSLSESAQMAIEGGAQWLLLKVDAQRADKMRGEIVDIVAMCKDKGIILTIENCIEQAREYGLHGVFISDNNISPLKVREELGAEAIIGSVVATPDSATSLYRGDIDYVAFSDIDNAKEFINDVRLCGCEIPIVAYVAGSKLSDTDLDTFKQSGFSGICSGEQIFSDSTDPVEKIAHIIKHLSPQT
ncbi:MAG: thiamine phosphate synthase [Muribaculaceae bacterium]|nr:thiamine phosphate synthase [Muribaculaceae bacterium]